MGVSRFVANLPKDWALIEVCESCQAQLSALARAQIDSILDRAVRESGRPASAIYCDIAYALDPSVTKYSPLNSVGLQAYKIAQAGLFWRLDFIRAEGAKEMARRLYEIQPGATLPGFKRKQSFEDLLSDDLADPFSRCRFCGGSLRPPT